MEYSDEWVQTTADQWILEVEGMNPWRMMSYLCHKQAMYEERVYNRIIKIVHDWMDPEGLEIGTIWDGPSLQGRTPGLTPQPQQQQPHAQQQQPHAQQQQHAA